MVVPSRTPVKRKYYKTKMSQPKFTIFAKQRYILISILSYSKQVQLLKFITELMQSIRIGVCVYVCVYVCVCANLRASRSCTLYKPKHLEKLKRVRDTFCWLKLNIIVI